MHVVYITPKNYVNKHSVQVSLRTKTKRKMSTIAFFGVILFLYAFLLFIDMFFKSCSMYPYINLLKRTGIEIKGLSITWQTTAFNRSLLKFRSNRKSFITTHAWFDVGVYSTIILLPLTVGVLVYALNNLTKSSDNLIVEPVIPGVTYPIDELGYYLIALASCSFVHEFGHAIAAVDEDVHIYSIGVTFIVLVPIAFVQMANDQMSSIAVWRRLRILCAGVWHNLMFALVAFLLLTSLPYALRPAYRINDGVYVTHQDTRSPLIDAHKGLHVGDVVVSVSGTRVTDEWTWTDALARVVKTNAGYCVDADFVHAIDQSDHVRHENGEIQCCKSDDQKQQCFEYLSSDGAAELPPYQCLNVREIVEHSRATCYDPSYCASTHCIRPLLKNHTSLIVLKRAEGAPVVFIGHPSLIYRTVGVSSYIPRYTFVPAQLATRLTLLLNYMFVFSLGLAFVNVIPCWWLDGQHIINELLGLFLHNVNPISRRVIALTVTLLGTVLLSVCVMGGICVKLFR